MLACPMSSVPGTWGHYQFWSSLKLWVRNTVESRPPLWLVAVPRRPASECHRGSDTNRNIHECSGVVLKLFLPITLEFLWGRGEAGMEAGSRSFSSFCKYLIPGPSDFLSQNFRERGFGSYNLLI